MPIIQAVKSLNAGKFSPLLRARDEYVASCKTLKNFIPTVQGPLQRRAGTRYVADITGAVRLLPFVFSPLQRYLFVFYENKIDVMNGETVVKTLQTSYKAADIPNLFYTQVQDVMFLAHADYPMKKNHADNRRGQHRRFQNRRRCVQKRSVSGRKHHGHDNQRCGNDRDGKRKPVFRERHRALDPCRNRGQRRDEMP